MLNSYTCYMHQYYCIQAIQYPTTNSHTIIDHVWTNMRQDFFLANPLHINFSNHRPIHFSLLIQDGSLQSL